MLCTIAGSDPTGGAGVQADLKTFEAHGARGFEVVTARTVQDLGGVVQLGPRSPERVAGELRNLLSTLPFGACKTGMLATGTIIAAVATVLDEMPPPMLVVDPVLVATAGGTLLEEAAVPLLAARLAAHATVITPNRLEAARLLGVARVDGDDAERAAHALVAQGWRAVLLKGGHGDGAEAVDLLATPGGLARFALPRLEGPDVHGTGCALSAALAARLGRGEPLPDAVEGAKDYVHRLIEAAHASKSWILPHLQVAPRP